MMAELETLAKKLADAHDYTDIFDDTGTLRATYLKIVGVVHPDRYLEYPTDREYRTATTAFQKLQTLYATAQNAATEGRFGEPVATIRTTKGGVHVVKRRLAEGDIATLFQTEHGLLKIARSARDNDLLEAEAKALKRLHSLDTELTRAYPKLLDTFLHREGRRRGNVMTMFGEPPDCYNLAQLRERFPGGLHPVQVAWIWRRLLVALDYAHNHNLVHGAVLPPHVLILPKDHGVLLVDWCYCVSMVSDLKSKTPAIKAIAPGYTAWYPEEVAAKRSPNEATDLYMAAECMVYLLGGNPVTGLMPDWIPRQMRSFFRGCLLCKQRMRPDDAGQLLEEFDQLLKDLGEPYYPRRFVEFVVPDTT